MNRPYTVCHIFGALDGAIAGNYMYAPETAEVREQYGKLRATFGGNAVLYGTTTMLDFCDGYVSDLPKTARVPRKDYIAPHTEDNYVVAVDRRGKLAYSQNFLSQAARVHLIVIPSEAEQNCHSERSRGIFCFKINPSYRCPKVLLRTTPFARYDALSHKRGALTLTGLRGACSP